jgi:hypothetical protein
MSRRPSNTVRTIGQAFPISIRSWISEVDTIWKVSVRHLDDVEIVSDDVQHFRIFWISVTTQKGVIAKPSGRSTKLSECIPVMERIVLFWKAVAEDRPDKAIFHPNARQPESEFVQI